MSRPGHDGGLLLGPLSREMLPAGVKLASYHLCDGIARLTISGFASVWCVWRVVSRQAYGRTPGQAGARRGCHARRCRGRAWHARRV
jgi:hypothetical protein